MIARASGALLAAIVLLLPQLSRADAPTLAVATFENHTTDPAFAPLGRGLADMLTTDLASVSTVQLVERSRIDDVMQELALQQTPWADPKSAAKLGKGLGARYLMVGALAAVEPTLRLDARVLDVQSGKVLTAKSVEGPKADFFLLEKELANDLLAAIGIALSARESAVLGRVATESFDAFFEWSKSLDAMDRGAVEEAKAALERALRHDDRFAIAGQMLTDLRNRVRELDRERTAARSQQAAALLAKIEELKASNGPYDVLQVEVVKASMALQLPGGAREVSALAEALFDLRLPEDLKLGGPQGVQSINEWAMYSYVLAAQYLGRRSDYLSYGKAFVERYPTSAIAPAILQGMERLLQQMQDEEAGRKQVPRVRGESLAQAERMRCIGERDLLKRRTACERRIQMLRDSGVAPDDDAWEELGRAYESAGDVAALEKLAADLLAADKYGQSAQRAASRLNGAQRRLKDAEEARADLAKADDDNDYERAARDLADAGFYPEAMETLDAGLERFPVSDDLFAARVRMAVRFGDQAEADATIAAWEKAEAQGAKVGADDVRSARTLPEQLAMAREADALGLLQLAIGLNGIHQYRESAAAWLELAERFPDYTSYKAAGAYQSAAQAYYTAWAMDEARKTHEAIIARWPDSVEARTSKSMLGLLPP